MKRTRIAIVLVGILLPHVAQIPGALIRHSDSLAYVLPHDRDEIAGIMFFHLFNMICWGSIFVASLTYDHAPSVWFPAVLGFALPAVDYTLAGMSGGAEAMGKYLFAGVKSLPLVFVGWLLGFWFDQRRSRRELGF